MIWNPMLTYIRFCVKLFEKMKNEPLAMMTDFNMETPFAVSCETLRRPLSFGAWNHKMNWTNI